MSTAVTLLQQLANFELTRLSFIPGKLLTLHFEGIAWRSAAVEEYQVQFYRPTSVTVNLRYAPVAKLDETTPIELFESSAIAEDAKKIRLQFDVGAIELHARELSCFQLRHVKFSRDGERRGRNQ